MKKIISIIVFVLFLLSASAQQQIITATLTITNIAGVTNGQTITVNGTLRTWTNIVTTAQNQILSATNITMSQTNIFSAYAAYPQSGIFISVSTTNIMQFQSFPAMPLTVAVSAGWATITWNTNTLSPEIVVRVPRSPLGLYEQTNVENGLIDWLSDNKMSNFIPTNAPAFRLFVPYDPTTTSNGLLAIVYQVGLQSTNLTTNMFSISTNMTFITSNYFQGVINTFGSVVTYSVNYFQPASAILSNLVAVAFNPTGASYLDGSGNIVLKQNGTGNERIRANNGSDMYLNYEDGNPAFHLDTGHNLYLIDDNNTFRFQFGQTGQNNGEDIMRSDTGNDAFILEGSGDNNPDTLSLKQQITFNQNVQVAVAIGTVTNFLVTQVNSGSSETHLNSYTFPANTFSHNGDSIIRTIGIQGAANGNSKTVKVYFDSTLSASASSSTSASFFYVRLTVTRISSTTYTTTSSITTGSGGSGATAGQCFAYVNTAGTVLDFTNPKECNVSLTGTSSSDLTIVSDRIEFAPDASYGF